MKFYFKIHLSPGLLTTSPLHAQRWYTHLDHFRLPTGRPNPHMMVKLVWAKHSLTDSTQGKVCVQRGSLRSLPGWTKCDFQCLTWLHSHILVCNIPCSMLLLFAGSWGSCLPLRPDEGVPVGEGLPWGCTLTDGNIKETEKEIKKSIITVFFTNLKKPKSDSQRQ